MIGPDDDLSDKAHQDEHHPHYAEEEGDEDHGAHPLSAEEDPPPDHEEGDEPSEEEKKESTPAEEPDRLGGVTLQEYKGYEIEDHAEGPGETVLRTAIPPRMIPHLYLCDLSPHPGGVGRDEAMHLSIEADVLHHLPPVGLEGATVIVKPYPGEEGDEAVRHHGGESAGEEGLLSVSAPAAHHIVALLQLLQQPGYIGRVVLEVRIHRDDDAA